MRLLFRRARFSVLALYLTSACGTQIGNPTGAGMLRLSDNSRVLGTVVNAAFLQSVDSFNAGDYAYSAMETRVSTARDCVNDATSKLSLIDKANSEHSVIDDSDLWSAQSEVRILRSYADTWSQNNVNLPCDKSKRTVKFDAEKLAFGSIRMESQIEEEFSRNLSLHEKSLNKQIQHRLVSKKQGERSLSFVHSIAQDKGLEIFFEIKNDLQNTLLLNQAEEGVSQLTLKQLDRQAAQLSVLINAQKQWTQYTIAQAQQDFYIEESGETLRLEFKNLVLTRAGACIPQAGKLQVSILRPSQSTISYSLSFNPQKALVLQQDGGTDSLLLAPFACVLKEK